QLQVHPDPAEAGELSSSPEGHPAGRPDAPRRSMSRQLQGKSRMTGRSVSLTAPSTSYAGPPPPLRGGGSRRGRCPAQLEPMRSTGSSTAKRGRGTTRRVVEGAVKNTDVPAAFSYQTTLLTSGGR